VWVSWIHKVLTWIYVSWCVWVLCCMQMGPRLLLRANVSRRFYQCKFMREKVSLFYACLSVCLARIKLLCRKTEHLDCSSAKFHTSQSHAFSVSSRFSAFYLPFCLLHIVLYGSSSQYEIICYYCKVRKIVSTIGAFS